MDLSQLHVEYSGWLWLLSVIPLVWILYFFFYCQNSSLHQLKKFIDGHLLPYLLVNHSSKRGSLWKNLLFWSFAWTLLVFALAGPRWDFREIETFSKDQSLVILLDLSESMNATDVKPSRLVRAKQKIEDLLNLSKGVKMGLIAFAADPHMITPITDDKETIRHLLPALGTDLIFVQGSRLGPAVMMAEAMLKSEPGNNQALLLISDGGFEDASAIKDIQKLASQGVVIYTMGIGTVEGAPLRDSEGNMIKKNGQILLSKLEREKLREISRLGNGRYLNALYSDDEEALILKDLSEKAEVQIEWGKKNRLWDERFYLFIFPVLPVILLWFRRGHLFAALLFLFVPLSVLQANSFSEYFKNREELAKQALDEGDYPRAAENFQDSYRKGVAYYKTGNFAEAEKMFKQSLRPEVASQAAYNLGNALVQQQKLKEALIAYEDVLKKWPDHKKAQENLELVKKMLEEQKQSQDQKDKQNSDQNPEKDDAENRHDDQNSETQENDQKKQNGKLGGENQDEQSSEQHEDQRDDLNPEQTKVDSQEEKKNYGEEQEAGQTQEEPLDVRDSEINQEEENNQKNQEVKLGKSQEDQDADLWLNRLANDPKKFLQNKFFLESKKNGTLQGIDPW